MPPERDLSGDWLDEATGIDASRIRGVHLRLPGFGTDGPTLELFEYTDMPAIRQILKASQARDYRWSSIILGVVTSEPFQMRRTGS